MEQLASVVVRNVARQRWTFAVFVIFGSGRVETMNRHWLADLYAACGCRVEARALYLELGHYRKVGDMALADGDLEGALAEFRKPAHDDRNKAFRGGPDHDHILALSFLRRDWTAFIAAFRDAAFDPLDERRVVFGNSARSTAPWARRLAIAAVRSGLKDDPTLAADASRDLLLGADAWRQMLDWATALEDQLAAEDAKLIPDALKAKTCTPAEATARGATDRAKALAAWIKDAPQGLVRAQPDMKAWMERRDRAALEPAVAWSTGGVLFDFTKTTFFELSDRRKALDGPPDRVCEAYRAHPRLMRLGLGHYLSLKIKASLSFTGEDQLTAAAEHAGISPKCIGIFRTPTGTTGLVDPGGVPWTEKSLAQRVHDLTLKLAELKRLESGGPAPYELAAKEFYGRLRDCWERLVEVHDSSSRRSGLRRTSTQAYCASQLSKRDGSKSSRPSWSARQFSPALLMRSPPTT